MFRINSYIFIIIGIGLILSSIWDYKVLNKFTCVTRDQKGMFKKISPIFFKINKIRNYWDGLVGIILLLIGLYSVITDKDLSDIIHDIFYKNKKDKKDKEDKEDKKDKEDKEDKKDKK